MNIHEYQAKEVLRKFNVTTLKGKVAHSGFTIRIRLNSKGLFPVYLCHYLKTRNIRKELVEGGTGVNIKSLNQGTLSSLIVYFPMSISEQMAIVEKVESLSIEARRLESTYKQKLNYLEELKKSILHKAFNGELKATAKELV